MRAFGKKISCTCSWKGFLLEKEYTMLKVWTGHSHQLPRDKFEFSFLLALHFFALEENFQNRVEIEITR